VTIPKQPGKRKRQIMTLHATGIPHIKQRAGVYVLQPKHPIIKKMRKILPFPSIHGHKIWPSSYLIMDYLRGENIARDTRIMEVGCGWGLLGIYCAKTFAAKVTGVDADANVLPYMEVLAELNDVKVRTRHGYFQNLPKKTLAKQHLIVGSDICFWDELTDALYTMIGNAREAGVKKIVIADPGREPFLKLAKKCKKNFGARLSEISTNWPASATGYLLIIDNG
jgi:predicted nicotinamide N-methyase